MGKRNNYGGSEDSPDACFGAPGAAPCAVFFPFVSGSKERLAAVDNIWLWRADHDSAGPVRDGKHPSKHGLIVRGDNGEPNA